MTTSITDAPPTPADDFPEVFAALPIAASVEIDRYCEGCGYNLHMQPVRRDPRTGVPLCRCPECGRFHAAGDMSTSGRLWLYRAARILLLIWIAIAWAFAFGLVTVHVALMVGMLDHARFATAARPNAWLGIAAVPVAISLLLGLIASAASTVAFSHWRWWSFLGAAFLWPLLGVLIIWIYLVTNLPQMIDLATPYVLAAGAAHLVGGLIGFATGRSMARAMVRVLIPPTARPVLSYLWTVDGKPTPEVKK